MQTVVTISVAGYQKFLMDAEVYDDDLAIALVGDHNKLEEYLEFLEVVEMEQVDQDD